MLPGYVNLQEFMLWGVLVSICGSGNTQNDLDQCCEGRTSLSQLTKVAINAQWLQIRVSHSHYNMYHWNKIKIFSIATTTCFEHTVKGTLFHLHMYQNAIFTWDTSGLWQMWGWDMENVEGEIIILCQNREPSTVIFWGEYINQLVHEW